MRIADIYPLFSERPQLLHLSRADIDELQVHTPLLHRDIENFLSIRRPGWVHLRFWCIREPPQAAAIGTDQPKIRLTSTVRRENDVLSVRRLSRFRILSVGGQQGSRGAVHQ